MFYYGKVLKAYYIFCTEIYKIKFVLKEKKVDFSNSNARKIYKDFGEEKVILDIKNTNLEVKFIKSYISILIYALIGIALGINIIRIKNGIFAYIAIFFIMLFFIRGVLSQICKIYFCKTGIILENKLLSKKLSHSIIQTPL